MNRKQQEVTREIDRLEAAAALDPEAMDYAAKACAFQVLTGRSSQAIPIAAEYLHGEAPATPLGQAEAEFLARRGRTAGAALGLAD